MADNLAVMIPESVGNLQLPAPELVTYFKDIENRVLWLDDEVSAYTMEFVKLILHFNKEDIGVPVEKRKPIKILFASPGGSLDTCNSLIDTIVHSKTPVWGINMSYAYSAACFIYLACHKRLCMPRATFLLHNGGAENITGTYEQVLSVVGEYQRQIEELAQYVKDVTTIPEDILVDRLSTEWYISADDSVAYGMTDKVIDDLEEVL